MILNQYVAIKRFANVYVAQYVESLSHAAVSMTKMRKRFRNKIGIVFSYYGVLRRSATKRISCFHDSLSRTKRMKASSERTFVTALVRALSLYFHEMLWAESAFMRCMETYRMLLLMTVLMVGLMLVSMVAL